TSFATPFVTGLALLLREKFPRLNPLEIRRAILEGATPILIDEQGNPFAVWPEDLKDYPADQVRRSQRIFGRGLINGYRSYSIAKTLEEPKLERPNLINTVLRRYLGEPGVADKIISNYINTTLRRHFGETSVADKIISKYINTKLRRHFGETSVADKIVSLAPKVGSLVWKKFWKMFME
ncbi:MAG: S8 family serine peptidase, partial [Chlamydiota bacterium]